MIKHLTLVERRGKSLRSDFDAFSPFPVQIEFAKYGLLHSNSFFGGAAAIIFSCLLLDSLYGRKYCLGA